jgi:catechol 2,3-dioxygenase-like lactoylglutathione lyase family enzyme
MSSIRGLAEVVLTVQDMQASVAFYRDVLGLQVVSPEDFRGPTFLQAGGWTRLCCQHDCACPC